jgi:hypothetical protein
VLCSGVTGTCVAGIGTANNNVTTASVTLVNGWNMVRFTAGATNYFVAYGESVYIQEVDIQLQKDLVITSPIKITTENCIYIYQIKGS